jgi:predicted signal transduction protein with EAL and GGDEF domain
MFTVLDCLVHRHSIWLVALAVTQMMDVIRTVLALGRSFGIPVLAEGIETPEQLQMLNEEGCKEGQGYPLGRPVPLDQITLSELILACMSPGPSARVPMSGAETSAPGPGPDEAAFLDCPSDRAMQAALLA